MARRRRKRSKRKVINLGVAAPSQSWHAEIVLDCPQPTGRKTFRLPGPTAAAAVRNVTNPGGQLPFYAMRCRVVKRRIVSG